MLIAKTVVPDQYWIVTDGMQKVGNVIANNHGFSLTLNGNVNYYSDTASIQRIAKINFDTTRLKKTNLQTIEDYPVSSTPYNVVIDIQNRIQLYTKTKDSKCYYAAGWFKIKDNDEWITVLSPKYIYIQRYSWLGPFKTEEQAKSAQFE